MIGDHMMQCYDGIFNAVTQLNYMDVTTRGASSAEVKVKRDVVEVALNLKNVKMYLLIFSATYGPDVAFERGCTEISDENLYKCQTVEDGHGGNNNGYRILSSLKRMIKKMKHKMQGHSLTTPPPPFQYQKENRQADNHSLSY